VIGSKNNNPVPSKEDLNELQRSILEIAEDQIVQKKNLHLYPLQLLEIAKDKIELQLKDHVFESLNHREVYYYIVKHPGCDTSDIMRDLKISFRFALKNLETLFIFGFIRARKYSQYFLYFPLNMPEEEDMLYCLTRSRLIRKVLKFLAKQKVPVNVYEIAQALNKKEISIQRKLTRLVQQQMVVMVQVGLRPKYIIKNLDMDAFREVLGRNGEL
jgi:predicted transcriptional regulator